jgi:hypothetical protein
MDPRLPRILGALVALAAIGVVLALVLGGGDDDDDDAAQAQKRPMNVTALTRVLTPPGLEMRVAGEMEGEPIGKGAALITRRIPQAPRPGGEPVPLDLAIAFSQPGGSFDAKFTGTVQVTRNGTELVNGSADVSNGTDRYEGITGSFDLRGRNGPDDVASRFAMKGTLEY